MPTTTHDIAKNDFRALDLFNNYDLFSGWCPAFRQMLACKAHPGQCCWIWTLLTQD